MRRRFITADVFTDQPFGGNPVAVLPDAAGLSTDQMQRLAREFNLSETVFVLPAKDPTHTREIRIFVPTEEVPFAGHPTIGTAIILSSIGEVAVDGPMTGIVLKTEAGPVPVTIGTVDGRPVSATLTAPLKPELRPAPSKDVLAAMLSLQPEQIVQAAASSCGLPFLLIEVADRAALGASRLDLTVTDTLGDQAWARWPWCSRAMQATVSTSRLACMPMATVSRKIRRPAVPRRRSAAGSASTIRSGTARSNG